MREDGVDGPLVYGCSAKSMAGQLSPEGINAEGIQA